MAACPSSAEIQRVVKECGCNESRAKALLRLQDNDPERAISFFQSLPQRQPAKQSAFSVRPKTSPISPHRKFEQQGSAQVGSTPKPISMTDPNIPPPKGKEQNPDVDRKRFYENADNNHPINSLNPIKPDPQFPSSLSTTADERGGSPSSTPPSSMPSSPEGGKDTHGPFMNRIAPELRTAPSQGHDLGLQEAPEEDRSLNIHIEAEAEANSELEVERLPRSKKWNFLLPAIHPPPQLQPGGLDGEGPFDIRDLVGAIQHGVALRNIQAYFGHYDSRTVQSTINDEVEGFPAMFYAVATNNEWIVRLFASHGGNVDAVIKSENHQIPLLGFAIVNNESVDQTTTQMIATLISLGATAEVIPKAFYSPYYEDLPENGPEDADLIDLDDPKREWCKSSETRARLATALNFTQRYYLDTSTKVKKPTVRQRWVAKKRNAEPLLGIPYFLIGQEWAATSLTDCVLGHMMSPRNTPLVLTFAGPSGHGKTELARRLGYLLSLEFEIVDCTTFSSEKELFGPRAPYVGSEKGSPLNNFLARKNGERAIVFLDEFEKTTPEIRNTLLIPFDKGEYQDRRHRSAVDCSKIIWILATNALDPTIMEFWKENERALLDDADQEQRQTLIKKLSKNIKVVFKEKFGPPLTGRITAFIPFLPFTLGEQAVGVHKFLMEFVNRVRRPINTTDGPDEQLLGNIRLRIRREVSLCRLMAKNDYDEDLGIRGLIASVRELEQALIRSYLDVEEEIMNSDEMTEYVVDVRNGEIVVTRVPTEQDVEGRRQTSSYHERVWL